VLAWFCDTSIQVTLQKIMWKSVTSNIAPVHNKSMTCHAALLLQALFASALTGGRFTGAALNPARVLGELL
jgi:glycerol uptake facilitator-like aquaporin